MAKFVLALALFALYSVILQYFLPYNFFNPVFQIIPALSICQKTYLEIGILTLDSVLLSLIAYRLFSKYFELKRRFSAFLEGLYRQFFRPFLVSLYRRLSYWLMGYKRPPFRLVMFRRYRSRPWCFLLAENNISGLVRGFFCSTESQVNKNASLPVPQIPDKNFALYLWPDYLRWHFFFFGILLSTPLVIGGITKTCGFAPYLGIVTGIFLYLLITVVSPLIIYRFLRIPVLDRIGSIEWPCSYKPFFLFEFGCKRQLFFPQVNELWDQVYYSPQASPQASLIKLAIRELYAAEHPDPETWIDRAFFRWLLFWLTPCWVSFVSLLLVLLFLASIHCVDVLKLHLVISITLWFVLSALFIAHEFNRFKLYSYIGGRDTTQLPAPLYEALNPTAKAVFVLGEEKVKVIFGLINTIGLGFFLTLIQVFPG